MEDLLSAGQFGQPFFQSQPLHRIQFRKRNPHAEAGLRINNRTFGLKIRLGLFDRDANLGSHGEGRHRVYEAPAGPQVRRPSRKARAGTQFDDFGGSGEGSRRSIETSRRRSLREAAAQKVALLDELTFVAAFLRLK